MTAEAIAKALDGREVGTGWRFVLPVPSYIETARASNAWTYGIDPDELDRLEFRT